MSIRTLSRAIPLLALGLSLSLGLAACGGGKPKPKQTNAQKAAVLIRRGSRLASNRDLNGAMRDFSQAAHLDPTNAVAYYDLGVGYAEVDNVPRARANLTRAIELDSKYTSAIYDLAILDSPSQPQVAVNLYNRLLRIKPNGPNVLYNLGLLLEHLGHHHEGATDIAKAVSLDPALQTSTSTTTTTTAGH